MVKAVESPVEPATEGAGEDDDDEEEEDEDEDSESVCTLFDTNISLSHERLHRMSKSS